MVICNKEKDNKFNIIIHNKFNGRDKYSINKFNNECQHNPLCF